MSGFIRNALQNEVDKMRAEIGAAGYAIVADGDVLRVVRVADPSKALPAPIDEVIDETVIEDDAEDDKKEKPKVKTAKSGELCKVATRLGECGGKLRDDGTCLKCEKREYAQKYYAKTHAKKA